MGFRARTCSSAGSHLREGPMRYISGCLNRARIAALLGFCVARVAVAQGSVQQRVIILRVQASDGRPIQNASVSSSNDARISRTDSLGEVRLPAHESTSRVRVRAVGYAPVDTTLGGLSGDTVMLALRAVGVQLDSIVVTAHGVSKPLRYANTTKFDTFYERRATSIGGKFFTREDIEQSRSSSMYDLIKKVPGTKIERDQTGGAVVRFERCVGNANPLTGRATESASDGTSKVVQVYVDGLKTGEPFLTLQNLKPENVEAVEVYQGVAQLPVDARGNGCAAIYIWTRYSVGSVQPAKR